MSNNSIVSVELLADHPHLVSVIGELRWREWGRAPEPDRLYWWVDVTSKEAGRDDLPVTWVAVDDAGHAVGAIGLGRDGWTRGRFLPKVWVGADRSLPAAVRGGDVGTYKITLTKSFN